MFPDYLLLINLFYLRVNYGFGHVYRPASRATEASLKGKTESWGGGKGRVFAYLAQLISIGSLAESSGLPIKRWTPHHLDVKLRESHGRANTARVFRKGEIISFWETAGPYSGRFVGSQDPHQVFKCSLHFHPTPSHSESSQWNFFDSPGGQSKLAADPPAW